MSKTGTLRTLTAFKDRLQGGGARPNLFEVDIPAFPVAARTSQPAATWQGAAGREIETFKFLCKAAALPASNVAPIDVPFRGRILKVAGDRTFDTWTVTIINDEDFQLRTAFELWMNSISKLDNSSGASNPDSYMVDAFVHQLGRGYNQRRHSTRSTAALNATAAPPLRTYQFYHIFPTNVSQIDLSYDSSDTIEEFTVEFQVNYWTARATDQTGRTVN